MHIRNGSIVRLPDNTIAEAVWVSRCTNQAVVLHGDLRAANAPGEGPWNFPLDDLELAPRRDALAYLQRIAEARPGDEGVRRAIAALVSDEDARRPAGWPVSKILAVTLTALVGLASYGCGLDADPATSATISDLRSQCWSGAGWSQCCTVDDDESTGTCCRETADDFVCWSW